MLTNMTFDGATDDGGPLQLLRREIRKHLLIHVDRASIDSARDSELRKEYRQAVEDFCAHWGTPVSQGQRDRLVAELIDETLGLGPLDSLLHDPTITDIFINGARQVYVERRGRLEPANAVFQDDAHVTDVVRQAVHKIGRRLDASCPMVDARLPDGSRLNAVIPPLALDGPLISIRRFSVKPMTPGDLIARGSITKEMVEFLAACVRARLNIMISGGTGSGKTSLLNVLSGFVPEHERIVTIEDAAELRLQQPHVARMEMRPAAIDGTGQVTIRDLLRNSLRMRPDRIIIGECRGEEAFDMLQSMTTGHDGSMTTIHANDARDAATRLEMLIGMAGYELATWFIRRQIASAIDLVVHCERLPNGQRVVKQISEITGADREVMNMHEIFVYEPDRIDPSGKTRGCFTATGIPPVCLDQLRSAGAEFTPTMFMHRILEVNRIDSISAWPRTE